MNSVVLLTGDDREHIARISYGKDSLKMLDVIHTRGLRLDRITTTDVLATDTIPAWLPPMDAFKARMDDWIWSKYRIDVEHLCARNKDGSKKTYEQMFYHIPVRRSQTVQVERERDGRSPGMEGAGNDYRIPSKHRIQLLPEAQNCAYPISRVGLSRTDHSHGARNSNQEWRPQGFPAQISSWCKKLKIDYVRTPFSTARHDGRKEISWNTSVLQQTNRIALVS